ncbi:MAG: hypothetical protein KIS66_11990 [Fimbriimonadaceae bacterium]|nr:hypothetical protein [Fimbriimonadaceae bacterium]
MKRLWVVLLLLVASFPIVGCRQDPPNVAPVTDSASPGKGGKARAER